MNSDQSPPKSSSTLIFSVVIIPTLLGIITIGGFYFASLKPATTLELKEGDRLVLVTANDLQPLLEQFLARTEWEEIDKEQMRNDGAIHLTYNYNHEDDRRAFELVCQVYVFPTRLLARKHYDDEKDNWLAYHDEGVTPKSLSGIKFGDASKQGVLVKDDKVWGYYYSCRRREKVYRIELAGLSFQDAGQFINLVKPCLEVLDDYEP